MSSPPLPVPPMPLEVMMAMARKSGTRSRVWRIVAWLPGLAPGARLRWMRLRKSVLHRLPGHIGDIKDDELKNFDKLDKLDKPHQGRAFEAAEHPNEVEETLIATRILALDDVRIECVKNGANEVIYMDDNSDSDVDLFASRGHPSRKLARHWARSVPLSVVLHRQTLPHMVPAAAVALFDEVNREGAGTVFSTSFARANNSLAAPVAQSANIDHAPSASSRAWLQRFNALVGDLTGGIYRSVFSEEYRALLETRAEITNPPCPGSAWGQNPFITSMQINCSPPNRQVAGTAGATHRDMHDDPLGFSMAFNASVLRPSTRHGLFLFLGLGCAVPLSPGVLVLFSGVELHRGMPMVVDATDTSLIPGGFEQEIRFQVIAYPNARILNGRLERATPWIPLQHVRWHPTRFNLVQHSLAAYGSIEARDEWALRELARNYINELHHILGREWVNPVTRG
ncbi:MAG: hypothetical protein M1826_005830 [Phylliscum demangeonii]|nr:MAG: hypothetical protein M1826_005830 [Phylliscum demangeonii]